MPYNPKNHYKITKHHPNSSPHPHYRHIGTNHTNICKKQNKKKQPRRATLFGFTLRCYSAGCSAGCCLTCWLTSFRAIPLPSTIADAKVFVPSRLQYFFTYQATLLFWYCGVTSGIKGRITACPTVSLLTIICWSAVRYLLSLEPPLLLCAGIAKSLRISMMMIFVGE